MKKNRIAVISQYPPGKYGGTEVVWSNLLNSFKDIQFKFYCVLPKETTAEVVYPVPKILRRIPNIFHLNEIFCSFFCIRAFLKDCKNYDVVFYDKLMGWSFFNNKCCRKIATAHGLYVGAADFWRHRSLLVYLILKYFTGYFERKSYLNADRIIAVSNSVADELNNYFKIDKKLIEVVYNGIDLDKFKPLNKNQCRKKLNLPLNKFVILFVGRTSYGKGFDIMKKLYNVLNKEPNFLFVFASQSRFSTRSINKAVFLDLNPNDMAWLYNAADVFVFPSRYEGCSLALLEAMASKVPILASNVGLCRELKNEKKVSDYIIESENSMSYLKLINLMSANDLARKKCAAAWYSLVKRFNSEKMNNSYRGFLIK